MKWFKHDSDASIDAKLQEILLDYGAAGYGLYWYCIELIAKDVTPKNITFELEHDVRILARNLSLSVKETSDMMQKFVDIGLFDISKNNKLRCIKLAYRLDDSMRKGRQVEDILTGFSRENPELSGKIPNCPGKVRLDIDKDKDKDKEQNRADIQPDKKESTKEKNSTSQSKKTIYSLLEEYRIEGQLAEDFITHRKHCGKNSKGAPITKTVLDGFVREAMKANITLQEAVRYAIQSNWQGFRSDWYEKNERNNKKSKLDWDSADF